MIEIFNFYGKNINNVRVFIDRRFDREYEKCGSKKNVDSAWKPKIRKTEFCMVQSIQSIDAGIKIFKLLMGT